MHVLLQVHTFKINVYFWKPFNNFTTNQGIRFQQLTLELDH